MTVNLAKNERTRLVRDLLNEHLAVAEAESLPIVKKIEDDLKLTLVGQSPDSGFENAVPLVTRKITKTGRGAVITIRARVIDRGSGQDHFIWNLMEQGRRPFVQQKTSPPIQERVGNQRTFERRLTVTPFRGFTGNTFFIPAGTLVQGIQAREWFDIVKRNRERDMPDGWVLVRAERK